MRTYPITKVPNYNSAGPHIPPSPSTLPLQLCYRAIIGIILRTLKGVWQEIFDFRFFSWIIVPWAPKYSIRAVSIFFVDTSDNIFSRVVDTTSNQNYLLLAASGASDEDVWGIYGCNFSWRFQWHQRRPWPTSAAGDIANLSPSTFSYPWQLPCSWHRQ